VGRAASRPAGPPRRRRPDRPGPGQPGQRQRPGQGGDDLVGPNPADRGTPGPKRHAAGERGEIPLAGVLTGAHRHNSTVFAQPLDAVPPVKRPGKALAAKADDIPRCRRALAQRRLRVRIARKGIASSKRLGRHRRVTERTLDWLSRMRRLNIRYERRADLRDAFLSLGCALVCFKALP
jgi:hypothetical protein